MQMPFTMPAARSVNRKDSTVMRFVGPSAEQTKGLEPAGCCAQACIDTPLGRVCHCVAEAPFC
jgi:hypothetical protein